MSKPVFSSPKARPPRASATSAARSADQAGGAQPQGLALSRLLCGTARAVQEIRQGRSGSVVLEAVAAVLRPGVQALLFQVLRSWGRAEALRRRLAPRSPPPASDALLCSALALLCDPEHLPYEPFTLVNQAVEAAKSDAATRPQAAFINACLRRFLREQPALLQLTDDDLQARWNHPRWWVERLRRDHPQHWQQILRANNVQAPMALRVNVQKISQAQYLAALAAVQIEASAVGEAGIVLARAVPVQQLPGFAQGWVSVQDVAAQMAAPLLLAGLASQSPSPLRVLDACAAPGGKTAHLLEHAGRDVPVEVTALEIDASRAQRIRETLQRLNLQARVVVADAGRPQDWWASACGSVLFDAILLDAPCTASGIVRRHPDVRWLRRESDIEQLAQTQALLLRTLWPLLRAGGRLLYCTCSVFRAEGDAQVQNFLVQHTDARLLPSPGHLLPAGGDNAPASAENLPREHDGFFYALLEKTAL